MKIFSIGNSFSQDAHAYLHTLAKQNGEDIQTVNLMMGGCCLEQHFDNHQNGRQAYTLQFNGGPDEQPTTLIDALTADTYDVVTLQQASHFSGMPQTYVPYITALAELVRKHQPSAKIYFQQTWSYEIDSNHGGFAAYNRDQNEMYRRLRDCAEMGAKLIDATIIPVGDTVHQLRNTLPEFDYKNGGMSLCRDGFHLSLDYGRFTAAAVWFSKLTGKRVEKADFENMNPEMIQKLLETVNKIVFG